jgi:hypothetical protein
MARAYRIETESGPAFRWGTGKEVFAYDEFDAESTVAALVKAVNVGVEAGDRIEGELELDIAALIKASGDAAWDEDAGFSDLYDDLNDCLPASPLADESSPYTIRDVAIDCSRMLVCYYPGNGMESQTFIVPFTLGVGTGVEEGEPNEPTIAPKEQWIEVEQETTYVEKGLSVIRKDGKVVWTPDTSYNSLQQGISDALPAPAGPNASIYVQDIALDGKTALICEWNNSVAGGASHSFIVGINVDDDDVTMMPRETWTEVEREETYVEKGWLALGEEMEALTKASAAKEPYGDVKYADPGWQEDKKKRYPLDTEGHIKAAWSYINVADNAKLYSAANLAKIKAAIKTAMKGIGAEVAKAGKVLSGKNASLIMDAITASNEANAKLKAALASAGIGDEPAAASTTKAATGVEAGEEGTYIITKSRDEDRYTMGPFYAPNRKDAHGEMIDPDILQKAVWGYVRTSSAEGRRINDQHDDSGDATTGEWVEVMAWPKEETWDLIQADGTTKSVTLPAGTIYMGIVWDEPEWKLIKQGKKTGLSMGGRTMRVEYTGEALDHMGWKHAAKKPPPHEYDGGKDGAGDCTSCGMSASEGNHLTKALDARSVLDLAAAANAQVSERERRASEHERLNLERSQKSVVETRDDLAKALAAVAALAVRPDPPAMGDIHVHVPQQDVNVNLNQRKKTDESPTPSEQ